MAQRVKPSLAWMLPAPLIFALGVGGGLYGLLSAGADAPPERIPFMAPATRIFTIDFPGTYVLWQEATPPRLTERLTAAPGAAGDIPAFVLRNAETLREIPSARAFGLQRISDTRTRVALAQWRLHGPGRYELQVTGLATPAPFAFGPSGMRLAAARILSASVLIFAGWAGAFALALVVFARRTRFRRMHARELNGDGPASEPPSPA